MQYIDNCSIAEIKTILLSYNEDKYRADQIYSWLYRSNVNSYDEMTNLPLELRSKLSLSFPITTLLEIGREISVDGTIKFVYELSDKNRIESVLLKDGDRTTGCISSQVGCRMGCVFCATYRSVGFKRNLTKAEILKQIIALKLASEKIYNRRMSNIVFMGMGEPLDNINNLLKALEVILDDKYLGFSHKKVTISTSGYLKNLDKLYQIPTPVNLAVSINASNQKLRSSLMPISKQYPLENLISKLKSLELDKRKRITLEYILIGGVNDSLDDAKQLVKIIKGVKAKINLIIYNRSEFTEYIEPSIKSIERFQDYLIDNRIPVFVRKRLGTDIAAACGQLAAKR